MRKPVRYVSSANGAASWEACAARKVTRAHAGGAESATSPGIAIAKRVEDNGRARERVGGRRTKRRTSFANAHSSPHHHEATDLQKLVNAVPPPPTVLTIGHSTRTIEEFLRLLTAHHVTRVVDVRTVPRSRHNPQFNRDILPTSLATVRIAYTHLPGLGGLRRPKPDSINTGWINASFRGYADYMQTPEFEASLERLIEIARKERVAIMCAEAVPWRCHRSLIADALVVREIPTEHILSETRRDSHTLRPFVKRSGIRITYPAQEAGPELL